MKMSKVQMLRALVQQRLTAAAQEIFGLFERTIAEYEEELCRSKEENERQRKLLEAVFNPQLRLHRADVQQLLVSQEEVPPEQQERSPSLDQEDPPEPPHIKEEQEELWSSQEGEQLPGLEEADITKFTVTPVPDDQIEDSSDPETEDSDDYDWMDTRKHQSGLNSLKSSGVSVKDVGCKTVQKPFSCSEFGEEIAEGKNLRQQVEKGFSCSVCDKRFTWRHQLKNCQCGGDSSQLYETEEKRDGPSTSSSPEQMETEPDGEDCGGPEPARTSDPHLQPDTDDKTEDSSDPETEDSDDDWEKTRGPQSGLIFLKQAEVSQTNTTCKTDSKPFSCSKCRETFSNDSCLKMHMRNHPAEKPFGCLICEQRFTERGSLSRHMEVHTGEFREAKQEDPPEPPHIKEEQEELWSSQEGEQLPGLEEADITKFTVTPVPVKSEEDDGEKPPSSQLHQRQTEHMEADGEDCGGPGPARTSDPELQPDTEDKPVECFEPDIRLSKDHKRTREAHLGVIFEKRNSSNSCVKPFVCDECGIRFDSDSNLKKHLRSHSGEKPFGCPECASRFANQNSLAYHLYIHTGEKPFSCSVCKRRFIHKGNLTLHMRHHTGEKPFSCSECGRRFVAKPYLNRHLKTHTLQKRFTCGVCGKRFLRPHELKRHSSQCGGGGLAASPSLDQSGEQLPGLEEAHTPVLVKTANKEEVTQRLTD